MALMLVLGLMVGGVAAMVIGRGIAGPLQQMVEGADKIGRGQLDHRIEVKTKDEIGDLAAAFNNMTKKRQRAEEELKTHRANLEELVAKRTAELSTAIESLEAEMAERRRAQAAALASEKLASVGRLTAGVSHEILNPLNIISISLQMMIEDRETPPEIVEELHILEDQANRINKITQDLLFFSRQREPEHSWIDLGEVAERTLGLLERDLRLDNIEVELKLAEGLPPVLADQDQLQQVVLNLLTNAKDAMPQGGSPRLPRGPEDRPGALHRRLNQGNRESRPHHPPHAS